MDILQSCRFLEQRMLKPQLKESVEGQNTHLFKELLSKCRITCFLRLHFWVQEGSIQIRSFIKNLILRYFKTNEIIGKNLPFTTPAYHLARTKSPPHFSSMPFHRRWQNREQVPCSLKEETCILGYNNLMIFPGWSKLMIEITSLLTSELNLQKAETFCCLQKIE